jgi:hypothetical protein
MKNRMWPSVDPYEDWKYGPAQLARYRFLAPLILVDCGGLSYAWSRGIGFFAPALACSLPLIGLAFFLRGHWIKELKVGVAFHATCHHIRDSAASLERLFASGETQEYSFEYSKLHDALSNRMATYFKCATRDSTVECAIRLARNADDGSVEYVTKGRSDGMDPHRKDISTPIPWEKGLARKLRDNGERGVCHVVDIPDAVRNGWWMQCPSDRFSDVKFLMVAPINWYDHRKGAKVMGGMLFVTSRRNNLAARHVEPTKGFADLLGMIYPSVTGTFQREE